MSHDKELANCIKGIIKESVMEWLEDNRSEIISAFANSAVLREREQKEKQAQGKSNEPIYFTPGELAERWGFHEESIRRMIRQGRLPKVQASRRVLIPVQEIKKYEQNTFRPANES